MRREPSPVEYLQAAVVAQLRLLPTHATLRWNDPLIDEVGTARGELLEITLQPVATLLGIETACHVMTPELAAQLSSLGPLDIVTMHDAVLLSDARDPWRLEVLPPSAPWPHLSDGERVEPVWSARGVTRELQRVLAAATKRSDLQVVWDPAVLPLAVRAHREGRRLGQAPGHGAAGATSREAPPPAISLATTRLVPQELSPATPAGATARLAGRLTA